ncbi:MAG TPA: flavodoxin-dependent (E)-4-hydroxy-3-methylbut-2-enyl-diphosphate synthase [Chitinophagaceae bacterium]|nr:flavodoxin-dependent (E)-4-hydroxy-3-methylbut-2-enyl-diphosphate synthase [Chitinophagaceae bacterium]
MHDEFGECYPLHLGVTEAGDGEDGRIKSAIGIGSLLEDGIGDTIRVSLTEDPEFEIPVCKDLVKRYSLPSPFEGEALVSQKAKLPYSPFEYQRRETFAIGNIGENQVPVVIADLSKIEKITPMHLQSVGYTYNEEIDKWSISDTAADYVFTGHQVLGFDLPGTLKVIVYPEAWKDAKDQGKYYPIFSDSGYAESDSRSDKMNFVMVDCTGEPVIPGFLKDDPTAVICLSSTNINAMQSVRSMFIGLMNAGINNPVILITDSKWQTPDEHLIHFATETGALLLDGLGDGICLGYNSKASMANVQVQGRTYLPVKDIYEFTNNTSFSILQATRTRISKTEYISCPSCGRTLFDLQETTAKIRAVTNHLKGVKIAIMGCIVNGPGEMADADFGYVGSGPGKITLYKGKEVMKRNVNSDIAVEELINLLKENNAWIDA